MKKHSYAGKASKTEGSKKRVSISGGGEEVEEEVNVESLLQQEADLENSITTVDERVRGPAVPQPTGAGGHLVPPFTRFQGGAVESAMMYQGHPQGQGPPLNIYSQGSPPLPLAGPLHLVYLQPSPHGLNIIPFQAVGCPTFSPSSPLGFPAHPHHPVVVQSPHLPPPFPSGPHDLAPEFGRTLPGPAQPPPPGFYPQNVGQVPPENKKAGTQEKFFRPWEQKDPSDTVQSGFSDLKIC